eukprot:690774-Prymnesium_polylepis.2
MFHAIWLRKTTRNESNVPAICGTTKSGQQPGFGDREVVALLFVRAWCPTWCVVSDSCRHWALVAPRIVAIEISTKMFGNTEPFSLQMMSGN